MLDKFGIGGNDIINVSEKDHLEASSLPKQDKKYSLFDYIKFISETNDKIDVQNNYSEFMINRMLSNHIDCILYIGFANRSKFLNKQSHFDYLQNSIKTKTKRYSKKQEHEFSELENILLAILLSKKWVCSIREALLNLSFCSNNEKKEYIKKYKSILDTYFDNNTSYLLNNYTKEQIKNTIEKMKESY